MSADVYQSNVKQEEFRDQGDCSEEYLGSLWALNLAVLIPVLPVPKPSYLCPRWAQMTEAVRGSTGTDQVVPPSSPPSLSDFTENVEYFIRPFH